MTDDLQVFGFEDAGPCGYYRIRLPFDVMKARGLDVEYANVKDLPLPPHDDRNVIVGQQVYGPDFDHEWYKLRRAGHRLVWETDDDLWHLDRDNPAWHVATPERLHWMASAASIAHMVTVTTEPLAEQMRQFNDNVRVIPNHIDGALLEVDRVRRDRLTIGWAGGNSHLLDFQLVVNPLRDVLRAHPGVDLHTIGVDYGAEWDLPQRRHTGWSTRMITYYTHLDFDIGIAPLRATTFTRSKSHIKALEYSALGIPVVASDTLPYASFVVDGVTGFLCRSDDDWRRALTDLINDDAMREEMGRAAREHARTWSMDTGWRLWADAYRSLLEV